MAWLEPYLRKSHGRHRAMIAALRAGSSLAIATAFAGATRQRPMVLTRRSGRKSRTDPVHYGRRHYKRRNRIEIMFGQLKDWRRVATRCDRCPTIFLSAAALAVTVLFWE
jgi:transposase